MFFFNSQSASYVWTNYAMLVFQERHNCKALNKDSRDAG